MQRCCKYSYRCRDVLNTLAVAVAVAVAARRCICICAPGNTRLYLHIQTSIPTAQATILHSNQYCYSFHIVRTVGPIVQTIGPTVRTAWRRRWRSCPQPGLPPLAGAESPSAWRVGLHMFAGIGARLLRGTASRARSYVVCR
jgi:hypothetical protein